MDAVFLKRAKVEICRRIEELRISSASTVSDRAVVVLDQQLVGRLSRMDAIQQQAMAVATQAARNKELVALSAALDRIEAGEFGYCVDCGDEIGESRLERMPTTHKCADCMQN